MVGIFFKLNQNIMRISELPESVKQLALENQKKEKDLDFDRQTDCLYIAFDWDNTPEGFIYWSKWNRKNK